MYKNSTSWVLFTAIVFSVVLLVVSHLGQRSRRYAPGHARFVIETPQEAFSIWQENQVKGRTLLLFDNFPHMWGRLKYIEPHLNSGNLIEFSIFNNIVRKVYLVVSEEKWDDLILQKGVMRLRSMPGVMKGAFLYTPSGIPFTIITPSSLPYISEKVLVYINCTAFTTTQAEELLANRQIESDILIMSSGGNNL